MHDPVLPGPDRFVTQVQYRSDQLPTGVNAMVLMPDMIKEEQNTIEFLYQEKNSELISSAMFARYAYGNYNSIMLNDNQRQATIASLQEVKRIALKDIFFYMNDMDSKAKVPEDHKDAISDVAYAFAQTKNCGEKLNFSLDLYSMATIMEAYYSQNFEQDYLENIVF